jgi:hypothetical protein
LRSKAIYQEEIDMNTPDCLLRPEGVGSFQDFQPAWRSSLRLYFGPCLDLIIFEYAEKST